MKKLIKHLIIFTFPILIFLMGIEFLIRHVPNDYSYKREYVMNHGADIETLILGSSHTFMGINPEYLQLKSFNLANISQSLLFDKIVLFQYKKLLPNLKRVIIPISYFTFAGLPETSVDKWRKYNYLHFMGCKSALVSRRNPKYYFVLLSKGTSQCISSVVNYLLFNKFLISCNEFGWCFTYRFESRINIEKNAESTINLHENGSLDFSQNIAILKEIIEFSKQNKFEVILITTPTSKYYRAGLNAAKLDKIRKTIESFKSENNIQYLNYSGDERFQDTDFYDADHLNNKGVIKFSQILKEELSSL